MRTLGTYSANGGNPIMVGGGLGGAVPNAHSLMTDSAVATGKAALISELQKRDPQLREPLTSITYLRDIPMETGGGWVDTLSAMYVQYGVVEGSGEGLAAASGANESAIIQADIADERWGAHVFDITMRVGIIDQHRGKITGRNIEEIYREGIRLSYDKHNQQNGYLGMRKFGTFGLFNTPSIPARLVDTGSGGGTVFKGKEPDEILQDINNAITTNWNRCENDESAIPNHILMPHEQLNYLVTQKVSFAADKSILTYIRENNITNEYGGSLFFGATNTLAGAGTGGTDRMVVYHRNKRFVKMGELVGLHRAMTSTNTDKKSYDSLFLANISQLQIFYEETVGYYDGI